MAAAAQAGDAPKPIRVAISYPPVSLNPRSTLDATGQRIGALLFRALTRIDGELRAQPDLASQWQISNDGKTWAFSIRDSLTDHEGQSIDAAAMARCLEEYRVGKPTSALKAGFPTWIRTQAMPETKQVVIHLSKPDPYLARNLSLLRYFRTGAAAPCSEPKASEGLITSGILKPASGRLTDLAPQNTLELSNVDPALKPVRFIFMRDGSAMALKLLKGEIDAIQNGLSLTKTRWIQRKHGERFKIFEREGVTVSYTAFNLKDPILKDVRVRRAIAAAIPRQEIVEHKMMGFGSLAGSFLSPLLPEAKVSTFQFDPVAAERLLDQAGYRRSANGTRFSLSYRTTPVREGYETALMIQAALKKIGITVLLDVVEPAVWTAGVRAGKFQMISSRWVGVSDGSIFFRTLHSAQPNNRVRYRDREMDRLLEQAMAEVDDTKRKELLGQVQDKMARDLPYVPLWYWSNAAIVRKPYAQGVDAQKLSLSGAYEPLLYMMSK